MTEYHIPKLNHYKSTLNRMGWSMLLFIGLFYFFTLISEICSISLEEMLGATPVARTIAAAVCGILSAVCYMAPFFLSGCFYYLLSRRTMTERVDFSVRLPASFPLLILAGLAILSSAAYLNSVFCSWIGYRIPDEMVLAENYDNPAIVAMYMSVALAPAFAEEFLFRGVFYSNLRPYGRAQAILISSLLFALMHQNIGQLFYTFIAGIAMAIMYELTGSIWCGVFFHMINNEMSIISEVLYYGSWGEIAAPFLSVLDGTILVLGTVSLFILILYYTKKANESRNSVNRGTNVWSNATIAVSRFDTAITPKAAFKTLLTPGMISFTAVTVVLMLFTWLSLIIMGSGGV